MVSPFGGSSTALKFLVGHLNKGIHSFIHSFVNIKINVPTNHIESGKICHTCRSSYPLNYSKACNFQESMTKNKTQSIIYLTFFYPQNNCRIPITVYISAWGLRNLDSIWAEDK